MTSTSPVSSFSKFSLDDIKFSEPRVNVNKGKTVFLNRRDGGKILIQGPKLRAPFGLGTYEEVGKPSSYRLTLSVENDDFKDFLKGLDDLIIARVAENSEFYLGKAMNETVIREALYTHILKQSSDPKYAPGFNLKVLRSSEGQFNCYCVDTNRDPFDIEKLEKGQAVTPIFHLTGIWFIGTKFGVTARLEQLRVTPSQKLVDYAFIDEDDGSEVAPQFLSDDEM